VTAFTAWALEVGLLVVLCAGFTYPVVAYSQNVLYRGAVLLLVAALACLMVGSVLELLVDLGWAGAVAEVAAYAAYAASALVSVAATWRFAREFVSFDDDSATIETDDFVGGFERDP